jgi:hypothetical protein
MLKWRDEDPKLPVSYDISKLQDVFERIYGFDTELWDIPDEDCHTEVNQKIIDFSRLGGNSKEDLKILFYAGHGKITSQRLLSWTRYEPFLEFLPSHFELMLSSSHCQQLKKQRNEKMPNGQVERHSKRARRGAKRYAAPSGLL